MAKLPRAQRRVQDPTGVSEAKVQADLQAPAATQRLGRTIATAGPEIADAVQTRQDAGNKLAAAKLNSKLNRAQNASYANLVTRKGGKAQNVSAILNEEYQALIGNDETWIDENGNPYPPEVREAAEIASLQRLDKQNIGMSLHESAQTTVEIQNQVGELITNANESVQIDPSFANYKDEIKNWTARFGAFATNKLSGYDKATAAVVEEKGRNDITSSYLHNIASSGLIEADETIAAVEGGEFDDNLTVEGKKTLIKDLKVIKSTEVRRTEEGREQLKGEGYSNIIKGAYPTPSALHNSPEYRGLAGDANRQKFLDGVYSSQQKWLNTKVTTGMKNQSTAEYARIVTLMTEQGFDAISDQNMLDMTKTGDLAFKDYEKLVKVRTSLKDSQIGPELKLKLEQVKGELALLKNANAFDADDEVNNESLHNDTLMQATLFLTDNPKADITPLIDEVKKNSKLSIIDRIYFNPNFGAISEGLISGSSGAVPIDREKRVLEEKLKDVTKPEDLVNIFKAERAEQETVRTVKDTAFRQRLFAAKALELNNIERARKGQKPLAINEKNIQAVIRNMLKATEE